jgi:hypothetical protein
MLNNTNTAKMEALHASGSVIAVSRAYDLRTLKLLADSGYTHVRMPTWAWEPIATAIDSATPASQRVA